ncbi:MAG: transposase [Patescibacteria group bacterium]|nr:transposase [Patescibacteria group bacterium]
MSRQIEFSVDEFYHLYNRGNDKRDIFLSSADRRRFTALLYLSNSCHSFHFEELKNAPFDFDRGAALVDIGAYCLMTNHYHLLVRERQENGISQFMHRLSTGYTMYFNKRWQRRGSLFEGRFRANHAGEDRYLHYLFAYIHLNPVKMIQADWRVIGLKDKASAKDFLGQYLYSSYQDCLGLKRESGKLLAREAFPDYFSESNEFDSFLSDWLNYHDHEVEPRGERGLK